MLYDIQIKRKAQKSLAKIPEPFQENIITAIQSLATNPHPQNSKKLQGRPAYRIRIGQYRVIYEIDDGALTILVINVGHRKNIYKN